MKKALTAFLLLALVSAAMLGNGCASTTSIGDIKANPSQYEGKEVSLKGTVNNSFWLALLTKGAYELTDNTGSIWVVCSQTPPSKNTIIKIRGTVEKAVTIGDRSLGTVIIENNRENL